MGLGAARWLAPNVGVARWPLPMPTRADRWLAPTMRRL
jgi:hypothetical protein